MSIRVALYAEAPHDLQCEIQLHNLREYSARQGWVVVREYVNSERSGNSTPLHPGRGQLRKDAYSGHFDLICVWRLESWNCGSVSASLATIREFLSHGQRFIAVADNIHLERSNPESQRIMSALAACAVWERQGTHRGVPVQDKAAAGKNRKRKIVDRTKLRQLRAVGYSVREIAAQLGRSRSVVHRALQSMRVEGPL
jgi:DNA invertase Pin-like site-specific DNA recombinase